ncbi:cysteine desulfurase NifS [Fusibacter sp. JL216-2]|uniref:cysteine desulfurase NifS n=1 Tax=Fusibacter sp. JL216-2 TaxID=3071453 RepID=UPI003D357146
MNKRIYMDYSATTPMKKEVLDAMMPYMTEHYGNASSVHSFGRDAKNAINTSREKIAKTLGANREEVYFTAGGTESDNWAIKGIAKSMKKKGNHIITSKVEHHAVLHTCETLEKEGYEVTYLDVDEYGMINLDDLKAAIKDTTILISIMFINNEIGTKQPVKEIGAIAKEHGVLFHTDAVQAYGNTPIDVNELNIDLLSISSHKIYGPKGIGAMYVRRGVRIGPFIDGGAQERKRRAGTENVPGIVGFAKAAELAIQNMDEHIEKLTSLRERLRDGIMGKIPYAKYNGHPTERHPGNVNICFEFIEGESLLLSLDLIGVAASSGSACTSGSLDPSHVLMSIGLTHEIAHGSLRLTIGDFTTEEDVDYVIEHLVGIVDRLRQMSPLYEAVLDK